MSDVASIGKVFSVLCDTDFAVTEVLKGIENAEDGCLRIVSGASLGAATVFRIACSLAGVKDCSLLTQKVLKIGELISRGIHFVPNLVLASGDTEKNQRLQGENKKITRVYHLIEKGLIRPLSSLFRAATESGILTERRFLEASPEERAQMKRSVYLGDGEYEYKSIDLKECEQNLDDYKKMETFFNNAEYTSAVSVRFGIGTTAINIATTLMEEIKKRRAALYEEADQVEQDNFDAIVQEEIVNPIPHMVEPEEVPQALINEEGDEGDIDIDNVGVEIPEVDPLQLEQLSYIPESLQKDLVFSKYICPISLQPIRYPVGDPNGVTIYERHSIEQAIAITGRSPITQQPLTPEMLVPKPALQALIDHRLKFYQQRFQKSAHEVENNQNSVDRTLFDAAKAENPHC